MFRQCHQLGAMLDEILEASALLPRLAFVDCMIRDIAVFQDRIGSTGEVRVILVPYSCCMTTLNSALVIPVGIDR